MISVKGTLRYDQKLKKKWQSYGDSWLFLEVTTAELFQTTWPLWCLFADVHLSGECLFCLRHVSWQGSQRL